MAHEIFICYRRKDTGGYAGRLYDCLRTDFKDEGVLFDVEVEGTAEILRTWVRRVLPEASVILVLIGDEWLQDHRGRQRLHEPNDIVRLEIELALSNNVPIIPVLIDGAEFPRTDELPNSIKQLTDFKGYEINNSFWEEKYQLLLQAVSSVTRTQVPIIRRGVKVWNSWRKANKDTRPNLAYAKLAKADLFQADLKNADLHEADLREANLMEADLQNANLTGVNLQRANLRNARLSGGILFGADLAEAKLVQAEIKNVDLRNANLNDADLTRTVLSDCQVYGVSVWNARLADAIQSNLQLAVEDTSNQITSDSIQTAVVIHLLLTGAGVRGLIETLTSKSVLLLGRFTPEGKTLLDALRNELRARNYVPILFDFDKPSAKSLTETILLLAHMSRFIVADITALKGIPYELQRIVPNTPSIPIVLLLRKTADEYSIIYDIVDYSWVLKPHVYSDINDLVGSFDEYVIAPAEMKRKELTERKAKLDKYMIDGL